MLPCTEGGVTLKSAKLLLLLLFLYKSHHAHNIIMVLL